MDYSPPGSSVHRIPPARKLECHFFFQGIFPTQGLNPCLMSPALAGRFFTTKHHRGSPYQFCCCEVTSVVSDSVRPIDGSPPGSPVPGTLQARTLEWVAISFSSAWRWKEKVKSLSRVRLLATPWTAAHQAPPSMGFSRREYWSGCHCLVLYKPGRVMSFPILWLTQRNSVVKPTANPAPLAICSWY